MLRPGEVLRGIAVSPVSQVGQSLEPPAVLNRGRKRLRSYVEAESTMLVGPSRGTAA